MPRPTSFAKVEVETGERSAPAAECEPDAPFHIALPGDSSGRENRRVLDAKLEGRKPLRIDRDNFDDVMARIAPKPNLPLGRPDGLPVASEARSAAATPARALDDFQGLLRDIVAPYVEPKPDPRQPELITPVGVAISGQMRALLHHPDFQALEARWRGAFLWVGRLSTDQNLKAFLVDIAKSELAADQVATHEPLIEGAEPWSLPAGNYVLDASREDLQLLGRMAAVARDAGAPFGAAESPRVFGCDSPADTPEPRRWRPAADDGWDALRRLPQASWLGLALPRLLLRLPYGKQTDSTSQFGFEECSRQPRHEDYLLGNPAFVCAYLPGEAFAASGWDLQPGQLTEISGLPLHVYREDGESQLKPCAETRLSEQAIESHSRPRLDAVGLDKGQRHRTTRPVPVPGRTCGGSFRTVELNRLWSFLHLIAKESTMTESHTHPHSHKHEAHRQLIARLQQQADDVRRITAGLDDRSLAQ